jgi:hypothetical protein
MEPIPDENNPRTNKLFKLAPNGLGGSVGEFKPLRDPLGASERLDLRFGIGPRARS